MDPGATFGPPRTRRTRLCLELLQELAADGRAGGLGLRAAACSRRGRAARVRRRSTAIELDPGRAVAIRERARTASTRTVGDVTREPLGADGRREPDAPR